MCEISYEATCIYIEQPSYQQTKLVGEELIYRLIVCHYFIIDCASDSTPSGYTNLANTKYGESAAANCDTGSGYSGTAALAVGACKTDGTWDVSKFSGCTSGGMGLLLIALFSC